ncbi:MAG: HEAT repeat domain-containing protein [Cyanobacteria bacterium J06632_3]
MSSEESVPLSQYSTDSEFREAAPDSVSSSYGEALMAISSTQAVDASAVLFDSAKLDSCNLVPKSTGLEPAASEPVKDQKTVDSEPVAPEPVDLESAEMISLDAQIAQAVEQLASGDFHSRWDYAKRFSQQFAHWDDRIIPPLIEQLRIQHDPDTQWFLVRILSQFEHPDIVAALAQLLVSTRSEELQIEVSKALSTLGTNAVCVLSEMLSAPVQEKQRVLAARALSHIRRTAVIEPLLGVTEDPNPELRAIAVEALGSFHDPRVTPVLLAALQDRPDICIEAIRTLGRRSDLLATTDLVSPLRQCLLAEDEAVACESAIALGRLGTENAIALLGDHLLSPLATPVKIAIVQALGWLSVQSAVTYLVTAFTNSAPIIMPAVKKEIAKALGQTRNLGAQLSTATSSSAPSLKSIAAMPLIAWLSSLHLGPTGALSTESGSKAPADLESFLLAQTVVSSLARLGAVDALGGLIPLLSHPDPRLRLHALNALKQIDPRSAQSRAQSYLHQPNLSPVEKQYVAETLAAW